MFDELSTAIGNYLSNSKNAKKLLVLTVLLIIIFILFTQFFLKGNLKLSANGVDGEKSFFISKIEDNSKDNKDPNEYKGSSVSLRLSPGRYRVELIVVDSNDSSKKAKSFKYLEVKARKTTEDTLTSYRASIISVKDTIDKASNVHLYKGNVDVTTVYGVTTAYSLEGDTKETIRDEPSFLNRVIGICRFSNGNAVAAKYNGEVLIISSNSASTIELNSYLSGEQLIVIEQAPPISINGTSNLSCKDRKVVLYGFLEITDDFSVKPVEPSNGSDYYNNLVNTYDGSWFFDKVDTDSLDIESSGDTKLKMSLKYLDNDGNRYDMDLDNYISYVSPLNGTSFCSFYRTVINCGDIKTKTQKEIISLEENREITNLATIDQDRVIYSIGNSVFIHNIKNGESSELYSSEHTVIPYTLRYDKNSEILVFGTQRIIGSDSSYNLPVIKID